MTWVAGVVAGAVVLIALVAVIPTHAPNLESHAAPAATYAEAVRRVALRQAEDDRIAVPGGRTILLTHGGPAARVVVLFHGLTNSPTQYAHIAQRLFDSGDNVYIPRLPHHAERGGTARTLAALTADELRACADSAMDVASGLGDSVVAAGVSAGGTIAGWIAQHRSGVRRAVLVAPVIELARVPSFVATPLMNLGLRFPNLSDRESPDPTRPDRELGFATHAVAQLLLLANTVRRTAQRTPPLARDIVFVLNANDHTVKAAAALDVARAWSTSGAAVTVYEFPRSLNLPHDIAEEAHPNADTAVVYPALEAVIHGVPPAAVLARRRILPH